MVHPLTNQDYKILIILEQHLQDLKDISTEEIRLADYSLQPEIAFSKEEKVSLDFRYSVLRY